MAQPTPTPQPTVTVIERLVTVQPDGIAWGDAANWAAAILTGLSLLLALWLFARDRRNDEAVQARDFVVWADDAYAEPHEYSPPYPYVVHAKNLSDYPVYGPIIMFRRVKVRSGTWLDEFLTLAQTADPSIREGRGAILRLGTRHEWPNAFLQSEAFPPHAERDDELGLPLPSPAYDVILTFTDAAGRNWRRNLTTGQLKRSRNRDLRYWASVVRDRVWPRSG